MWVMGECLMGQWKVRGMSFQKMNGLNSVVCHTVGKGSGPVGDWWVWWICMGLVGLCG